MAAKREKVDPVRAVTDFVAKILPEVPVYVGIDPGVSGAIGVLAGRVQCVVDIPVVRVPCKRRTKSGRQATDAKYEDAIINKIFIALLPVRARTKVIIERGAPHGKGQAFEDGRTAAGDTPKTSFMIGWATGMWPLFLTAWKFKYVLVYPGTWKRVMDLTGTDKNDARALCLRLWPTADVRLVKDHNRAEALLLAAYGRKYEPLDRHLK